MKQAILVVSFGTSYWNTLQDTIGATEAEIAAAFPEWEVRRAFTSGIIIRKIEKRDGIRIDTVTQAMDRFVAEGFGRVVVQPTHIMHGEEYEKLCKMVRLYQKHLAICVGMPLLHDLQDYMAVADALQRWYPVPEQNQAIVLMGHGTQHFANASYTQLDYIFTQRNQRILVGTVEGYPALEHIMQRLENMPRVNHVILAPLMVVAGDHAQNDMAGEEDSWKCELEEKGYQVTCLLKGLGECADIRKIFAGHCRSAVNELKDRAGVLYGVGVGPGDPELLTVKAIRILQQADVVMVPDTGKSRLTAWNIVRDYLNDREVRFVSTPMVRDKDAVEKAYCDIAQEIISLLDRGARVAYITLGDPSIYSTYQYIHEKVLEKGYSVQMIPGVPSFCAVAARLNTSLCQGDERLLIVPSGPGTEEGAVNTVFMKAGKSIMGLQQQLDQQGILDGASMVENCGLEGERVYPRFADLDHTSGYFSVVISKGEKT